MKGQMMGFPADTGLASGGAARSASRIDDRLVLSHGKAPPVESLDQSACDKPSDKI